MLCEFVDGVVQVLGLRGRQSARPARHRRLPTAMDHLRQRDEVQLEGRPEFCVVQVLGRRVRRGAQRSREQRHRTAVEHLRLRHPCLRICTHSLKLTLLRFNILHIKEFENILLIFKLFSKISLLLTSLPPALLPCSSPETWCPSALRSHRNLLG